MKHLTRCSLGVAVEPAVEPAVGVGVAVEPVVGVGKRPWLMQDRFDHLRTKIQMLRSLVG
jgi:hypothetical protein